MYPASKKMTNVSISDFILKKLDSKSSVDTCKDEEDPEDTGDDRKTAPQEETCTDDDEISETQTKKKQDLRVTTYHLQTQPRRSQRAPKEKKSLGVNQCSAEK